MKKMKKILAFILTAAMTFTLMAGNVFAAADTIHTIGRTPAYKFQISLYAGEHGTFHILSDTLAGNTVSSKSEKLIRMSELTGDEGFTISAQQMTTPAVPTKEMINGVEITGPQYYVKGFKISGQDNYNEGEKDENVFPNLTIAPGAIKTLGDFEYVVAYGIQGDQVKYIVNYVDGSGNVLAEADTFYGNIGDKPIIAYKYIDGFAPQTLAQTKTLSQNEAENVFTFIYDPIPRQEFVDDITEETIYNTVTIDQGTIVQGATNVTGGGAGGAEGAGGGTEEGGTAEGADGEETGIPGINEDDIVDLDDEQVPLANAELDEEAGGNALFNTLIYTSLGLLLILAIVAAYTAFRKRDSEE